MYFIEKKEEKDMTTSVLVTGMALIVLVGISMAACKQPNQDNQTQALTADELYELGRKHAEGNGVRQGQDGMTAFDMAIEAGHNLTITTLLAEHGRQEFRRKF